jgi:hypothetical protein
MEMPTTSCRVRYFSTLLYRNGNIATVWIDRPQPYDTLEPLPEQDLDALRALPRAQ